MALTDLTRISTSGIATGSTIDAAILRKDVSFRGNQVGVTSVLFDSSEKELHFEDNVKLKIGTHGDIQIYNDGTKSVIENGGNSLGGNNNSLHIYSQNDILHNSTYSQYFHCGAANKNVSSPRQLALIRNEGVKAYYNDNLKFETTNHGATVTGILTATGFSGPLSNASGISTFYDLRVTNNLTVEGTTTTLDTNLIGVDRVEVGADSNTVVGVAITQSGTADLVNLFDGSTKVVTVDDQGNVGLGSAIPSGKLDVVGSTNLDNVSITGVTTHTDQLHMPDDKIIRFGSAAASRTSIYYDVSSTRTRIRNFNDTLEIGYRATEIHYINQKRLEFINGGNRFTTDVTTTFLGANYHASWNPSSNKFQINDNAKLAFGSQGDAEAYHTGGNFYIDNDTGHFYIRNNVAADVDKNIYIQAKSGENSISCGNDGEVVLFSNSISANQIKLQTTGHGVHVTGIGTFTTSVRVTGSQNAQLTSNILSFDRAGYSYIDQTNNVGSLVFRVKANSTTALRIDHDSQSIFGASAHTIVGYGGTGNPYNNNSLSLYGTNNVGLVGQYSSLNMPMDHSNANVGGNWWMLGRVHGTTNEWGLSSRPGNSNTLRRIWRVVNKSDNSGLLDYQSFHAWNGFEALRINSSGYVGIQTSDPKSFFHTSRPSTAAVTLNFGDPVAQIFQCEDSEFALGLHNASPYPLYIQGRQRTNAAREITLNPLGGNIYIGKISGDHILDINASNNEIRLTKDSASNYNGIQLDRDASGNAGGYFGLAGNTNHYITGSAQHDICVRSESNLLFSAGGGTERLRIKTDGTVVFANKLTNSSSFTSHNANFYGGNVNTGGVRIELAHDTTTVSGNTASGAFPHHLLLSNYSGNGAADNRMCSIGFDIPTTSTHANATIAYQATAAGTGDLQFWLENGNNVYERLRIKASGNVGINETAPSEKLQIDGDILLGGQANASESNYAIKFEYNNHQFAKIVGDGRDQSGYGDIDFYTSTGSGASNLTQRMSIRADGKIGIGNFLSDNPATALHIDYDSNNLLTLDNSTASTQKMFFAQNGGTHAQIYATSATGALTFESDPSNNHSNSYINFTVDSGERLNISHTGQFFFTGTDSVENDAVSTIYIADTASYNAIPQAGITFRHKYHSNGAFANLAGIVGKKENNTNGAYGGILRLFNRTNGQSPKTRITLDTDGVARGSNGCSFSSEKGAKYSNSYDTAGWASGTFQDVIPHSTLVNGRSYLITFYWTHHGSGAPYISSGNFLFRPNYPNGTGEMGPTHTPFQTAHTAHGTSRYFEFAPFGAGYNSAQGIRARPTWSIVNNSTAGTFYIYAAEIAY